MIIYIPFETAQEVHYKTVDKSGGGSYEAILVYQ